MNKLLHIRDPLLLFLTLVATALGLIFIFDAGYARSLASGYGALPREFRSQLIFLPVALAAAAAIAYLGSSRLQQMSKWLWLVSLAALVLPFIPHIGVDHNGASRWFRIGPVEGQSAEFIKVTVILFLAGLFCARAEWPKRIKHAKHFADGMDRIYMPKLMRCLPAVWIVIAVVLIEKEPDMGTAFIVAVISFVMFFVGGVSRKSLVVAGLLALVAIGVLTAQEPYRFHRIFHHIGRWDEQNVDDTGYQTVQSELAMASGGLLGVGPGAGRAKHVLPAATTDFIAPTIGEEFGMVGMLFVLAILSLIVIRIFQLARKAPTKFGSMVLSGVGAWIGIQSCLNVMMANASLPAIGVPLPFISSGGSSLIALWMAVGLCQAALSPAAEEKKTEVKQRAANRNRWRQRRPRASRAWRCPPCPRRRL